jgi:hypothetical protein
MKIEINHGFEIRGLNLVNFVEFICYENKVVHF